MERENCQKFVRKYFVNAQALLVSGFFLFVSDSSKAQILAPESVFGLELFHETVLVDPKFRQERHLTLELISHTDASRKVSIQESESPNPSCVPGQTGLFFVRNVLVIDEWVTVEAECIHLSDVFAIWLEKKELSSGFSKAFVLSVLDTVVKYLNTADFEHSAMPEEGMLDMVNTWYGSPPNIRGDGIVDILFLDIYDHFGQTGSYIAGFFDPVNLIDHPFSNRRDMIYVDTYPTLVYEDIARPKEATATIVHEYQHLVFANYSQNWNRSVFINEGLSELAEILAGFEPRSADHYFADTRRMLMEWRSEAPLPDYSRSSLFLHYMVEQIGYEKIQGLVQNEHDGIEAFENVLIGTGRTFDEFFLDWGRALFYNNTLLDPAWGYRHPQRRDLIYNTSQLVDDLPGILEISLPAYSHGMVEFPLTSELLLNGEQGSSIQFSSKSTYPNGLSENNASHNVAIPFSANQFPHGSIHLLASNSNTQGYETVTMAIGEKSGQERIIAYDDGIPDTFSGNASYLLLNENLNEMAIRFDLSEGSWLNSISVKAVFMSEILGSQIHESENRKLRISIRDVDESGLPGAPLIPLFEWTFQRPFGNLRFESIPFK